VALHRGPGVWLFALACLGVAGYLTADRLGYVERVKARIRGKAPVRLSSGDFPAGVAAPIGEIASVPLRPTLIGFTPRGSSAALLLATGGAAPLATVSAGDPKGLFKSSYALDARAAVFTREEDLRRALAFGAENGGVDLAVMSVDRLAQWVVSLRDAAPRTVLLVGRSRGQEALAGVGVDRPLDLKGKRIAAYPQSPSYYFALWVLSRARLTLSDVRWVDLESERDAGRALREGRADAVAGLLGDVEPAARERGGKMISTTVDAPHLIAAVLVARGDFAARYPDAIRRVIRGLLDAGTSLRRDSTEGARLLGDVAPYLGDPTDAVKSAPAATIKENLAFFGLAGEAPVTYDELYQSAADLFAKIGRTATPPPPEDTRDLAALKYVAEARGP
jgi:ABC-type nitrate/sulfonate/bicarbonate transport system substrate-binding protein